VEFVGFKHQCGDKQVVQMDEIEWRWMLEVIEALTSSLE
jgi:hypothetical protein